MEVDDRSLLSAPVSGRLDLQAVTITDIQFDSGTASATLQWTGYHGPHFASYEVLRSVGATTELVFTTVDTGVTSFVDTGLRGNTGYGYSVAVRTARDEVVAGTGVEGRFHALVDAWPLDVTAETNAASEFVRVTIDGGRLQALVARRDSTELLTYSTDGALMSRTSLLKVRATDREEVRYDAFDYLNDQLYLVTGESFVGPIVALAQFELNGAPRQQISTLMSTSYDVEGVQIQPSLTYEGGIREAYRQMALSVAGDTLPSFPSRADAQPKLTDFEVGIAIEGPLGQSVALRIGAFGGTRLLMTWLLEGTLRLEGYFVDDAGVQLPLFPAQEATFAHINTIETHFKLIVADGEVQVQRRAHILWAAEDPVADLHTWSSAARLGAGMVFTSDGRAYDFDGISVAERDVTLPGAVADTRVWQVADDAFQRIGMAIPTADAVQWGTVIRSASWDRAVGNVQAGPHLPAGFGSLFYPLSIAGGPDGRVYVLDAGNSRVLCFDSTGQIISQWGQAGAGAGEFAFGDGGLIQGGRNLRGSIAVDEDGFIYVADPGNQRMQKFAP